MVRRGASSITIGFDFQSQHQIAAADIRQSHRKGDITFQTLATIAHGLQQACSSTHIDKRALDSQATRYDSHPMLRSSYFMDRETSADRDHFPAMRPYENAAVNTTQPLLFHGFDPQPHYPDLIDETSGLSFWYDSCYDFGHSIVAPGKRMPIETAQS
ncbi:uncharacterized protein FIESC28_06759 [Fusarium coffeatum]|uniref:Uncharacterized protein n=1 Tax=Fusarium coffeatum TaxID=231269 RepID=A0A366RI67_9HYPO|nr:uncharacterized protein FIESC28_06759 [Fusarium coffeatum]RBR16844.1 hypothetical protein FIESC28_06759 [Fusarium coffeatum]